MTLPEAIVLFHTVGLGGTQNVIIPMYLEGTISISVQLLTRQQPENVHSVIQLPNERLSSLAAHR